MEQNPKLAIIILNWNNAPATLRCLSLISGWSGLQFEIIVVDNNSAGEDIAKIQQSGRQFRFIRNNSNRGYAGGNNVGITLALEQGFSFIMLMNSDASIEEKCVRKLLEWMEYMPDLGVIGPLLHEHGVVYSGGRNIGIYSNTRLLLGAREAQSNFLNVDYVPGTVLIINREVFTKVGLLEEEYFFSGEIADFCERANNAGMKCKVFAGCHATHIPDSDSSLRDTVYNYYTLRNRFLFIRRHFTYAKYFLYIRWIASGTMQVLLAFMTGKRDRARSAWFGLRDGVTGRFGDRNDLFLR